MGVAVHDDDSIADDDLLDKDMALVSPEGIGVLKEEGSPSSGIDAYM